VVVRGGTADVVQPGDCVRHDVGKPEEVAIFVQRTQSATLAAGAVVGQQDDQGVIGDPGAHQELQQPADLRVGVGHEAGERLLEPGADPLLPRREVVPGRHIRVARSQRRPGRNEAGRQLPTELTRPFDVPAVVERPTVGVDEDARRLARAWHAPKAR